MNLSKYDREYASATPAERNAPLPDGDYICRVKEAAFDYVGDNRTEAFCLDMEVCDGQHEGHRVFKATFLGETSWPYLKADLQLLGIDRPHLSDVAPLITRLRGMVLDCALKKNKKGYQNCYINKVVSASGDAAPPADSGDDIPFG
jgi:hypothetical protein